MPSMYRVHPHRSLALPIALVLMLCFAACDGCAGCGEEPVEPPIPAAPDVGVEKEDEPVDPLAEAKKDADERAESVAIALGDVARAVAGEIEAAANAPKKAPRQVRKEPETGKLAKAELNKVFNAHAGAMTKCYERVLKAEPGLAGKVRIELVIRSSGEVKSATARGLSLKNSVVESCMERQAETMKFPEPDGGAVRVAKTYSFSPEF